MKEEIMFILRKYFNDEISIKYATKELDALVRSEWERMILRIEIDDMLDQNDDEEDE